MSYVDIYQTQKKYKVILCDPPWSYRNKNTGGSMKSGSSAKYPTMSFEELLNIATVIEKISEKDCALFLWTTVPMLQDALLILNGWGFQYKTALFWNKSGRLGIGFWYRGQVEILLLGIKGNVKAFRIQKPNFIQAKVREHSRKPDEFYDLIEATNLNPKIELFARYERIGFDQWGDECQRISGVISNGNK